MTLSKDQPCCNNSTFGCPGEGEHRCHSQEKHCSTCTFPPNFNCPCSCHQPTASAPKEYMNEWGHLEPYIIPGQPKDQPQEWEDLEKLSAELHDIYQKEAHRQEVEGIGPVRHYDEYEKLSEPVKEFDRVLARYIQRLLAAEKKASYEEGERNADWNGEQLINAIESGKKQGRAAVLDELLAELNEKKRKEI